MLWFLLAACASTLLLAVTNHLTQNIASIPFLWVLPLSLYLLTFILVFDFERLYSTTVFTWLLIAALGGMAYGLNRMELPYQPEARHPRLLRRTFPLLHVLPRRACEAKASLRATSPRST